MSFHCNTISVFQIKDVEVFASMYIVSKKMQHVYFLNQMTRFSLWASCYITVSDHHMYVSSAEIVMWTMLMHEQNTEQSIPFVVYTCDYHMSYVSFMARMDVHVHTML